MRKTWIIIIIVVILLGITIFIFYQNRETTISIQSYDRSSKFVLGKYKVIKYSTTKEHLSPMSGFKFKNEEDENEFLKDLKNIKEYIGLFKYYKYEFYYLFSNDDFFVIRKDSTGDYVLRPVFAVFNSEVKELNLRFHFPVEYDFDDSEREDIKLNMTYSEFIEYYERYSSDEIYIDYENKVIYSAAYKHYVPGDVKGKPIKITWTDDLILVEYVGNDEK